MKKVHQEARIENVYQLEGRVPVGKAIPFGLQHVLAIMFGALAMILGGLFPPIGAFFTTLPDCVLGGCTVIMFGSIMMSGVRMLQDAGMNQRNTLIAATSICLGVGATQVDGFFDNLPSVFGEIFAGNMVAGVFVVGLILEICLPKDISKYEI